MTFLFASAIDSSCPLLPDGTRVDAMDRGGHYARWEDDLELAAALGLTALRYGPACYRVHLAPQRFDWDVADAPMARLRALDVTVIACLCDGGIPSWMGGVRDIAFPVLFATYAGAFAQRYPWVAHYTPIADIAGFARAEALRAGGDAAAMERAYAIALRNLCMAHELAVEAILAERPDAIIVSAERATHVHPAGTAATAIADRSNARRFAPLDLLLGHELAPGVAGWLTTHGMSAHDLAFFRERRAVGQRWLGLGYDKASERRVTATARETAARTGLGFRAVANGYWQRYHLPLFHAGTQAPVRTALGWLRAQWEEIVALRASGVPVVGFTWAPLTDRTTGDKAEPALLGLGDARRRMRPVGAAYADLIARWGAVLEGRGERLDRREREAQSA